MRRSRSRVAVGLSTLVLAGFVAAGPAQALTINPTFDSSVSSLLLTQQQGIKDAFSTAAGAYQSALSDSVTINIKVSWGSVGGYAMPTNALGASLDPLYGYFTYAQIKSWLKADSSSSYDSTAIANLPAISLSGTGSFCRAPRPRRSG